MKFKKETNKKNQKSMCYRYQILLCNKEKIADEKRDTWRVRVMKGKGDDVALHLSSPFLGNFGQKCLTTEIFVSLPHFQKPKIPCPLLIAMHLCINIYT